MPDPSSVWAVNMTGVKLVHQTTGRVLAVTEEKYPTWGENMAEVVTTESTESDHSAWRVDFIRYPKYSK